MFKIEKTADEVFYGFSTNLQVVSNKGGYMMVRYSDVMMENLTASAATEIRED